MTEHKCTAELSREELETAFDELALHFDKAVGHLEHATRLIARQGQQYAEAMGWLRDIRHAAHANSPDIGHRELCLLIKDQRRRAIENNPCVERNNQGTTFTIHVPGKQPTPEEMTAAAVAVILEQMELQ